MKRRALLIFALCGLEFSLAGASAFGSVNAAQLQAEFDQALSEFDEGQALQADQPARARQLFRSAAQRFTSVISSGVNNGRLEFNLANCYLQAGDVGRAILHYRRAERLMPGDPMLVENLKVARSRRLTSVREARSSAVLRNLLFWHYQTSEAARLSAALGLYVLVWAVLIVRTVLPRRSLTIMAILCALASASAGGSVAVHRWGDRNAPEGVVIDMDVVVSKGPGAGYQRMFEQPLQPGIEFTLRKRTRSGWWNIELADGKSGWIEAGRAELIPPSAGGTTAIP